MDAQTSYFSNEIKTIKWQVKNLIESVNEIVELKSKHKKEE